jgi:hypothetical protein
MIAHISIHRCFKRYRGYAGCLETGVFRGRGVRLCTILDMIFLEFLFHALR